MRVPRNATNSQGAPNCVIDIGANDGVWTSNSYMPIRSFGYHGLLFEMDFHQCAKLYMEWSTVSVFCVGLGNRPGFHKFRQLPIGLENTFDESKSDQYDAAALTRHTDRVRGSNARARGNVQMAGGERAPAGTMCQTILSQAPCRCSSEPIRSPVRDGRAILRSPTRGSFPSWA